MKTNHLALLACYTRRMSDAAVRRTLGMTQGQIVALGAQIREMVATKTGVQTWQVDLRTVAATVITATAN